MPKDYPDFKSWKKLERYCKKTKTKCYITDVESGAACRRCYIKISQKNPGKICPFEPRPSYRSISSFFTSKKRVCLKCYKIVIKKYLFIQFSIILLVLAIVLLSLLLSILFKFLVK
jgi:hypothetical protein